MIYIVPKDDTYRPERRYVWSRKMIRIVPKDDTYRPERRFSISSRIAIRDPEMKYRPAKLTVDRGPE